ncbi:MAG: SAV_915 family protein [Demequina sp.]|uniref:SAV_915 family protein n=1 Tax=Demequina sp. TaxID=2050685 RepID=UPI003A89940C
MPEQPLLPPVVYVPCVAEVAMAADAQLEYRRTKDGRSALLAYSALDRLRRGMGDTQPWAVMPTTTLEKVWEADGFDVVLLDIEVPEEHRREGQA